MIEPISSEDLLRVLDRSKQNDHLGQLIAKAILLIQHQLDELGESSLGISFNGGKDCTVLLHLLAAVLLARHHSSQPLSIPSQTLPSAELNRIEQKHQPNGHSSQDSPSAHINGPTEPPPPPPPPHSGSTTSPSIHPNSTHHQPSHSSSLYPPIRSIYITAPNPFPALDQFVIDSSERYNLDLYRFGGGMKSALEEYLNCGGGKGIKGVFVGTRKGDPNGDVDELAPTDPSWPSFLRIHPILNWSYADIWHFLLELKVPYCELYDQGYTSLGSTKNTIPNPLLKKTGNEEGYEPAWKLKDESKERAGRLKSLA